MNSCKTAVSGTLSRRQRSLPHLLSNAELQDTAEPAELGLVVRAPLQTFLHLVSGQRVLHLLRGQEDPEIAHVLDPAALRQLGGGLVVAAPQKVLNEQPIDPHLLPLLNGRERAQRARRHLEK